MTRAGPGDDDHTDPGPGSTRSGGRHARRERAAARQAREGYLPPRQYVPRHAVRPDGPGEPGGSEPEASPETPPGGVAAVETTGPNGTAGRIGSFSAGLEIIETAGGAANGRANGAAGGAVADRSTDTAVDSGPDSGPITGPGPGPGTGPIGGTGTGPIGAPVAGADQADPEVAAERTEIFSRIRVDPTELPRPSRPDPRPVPMPEDPERPEPGHDGADDGTPGKRVRVVLSQRKGMARPVRTLVDVRELTQVGEVLSSSLIRSQLGLALRIGGIALVILGSLPAMFDIFPVLGRFELFGIRLPWLLLGVLSYPFLLALGWMYARSAERIEQVFADHIQD